jgi:hypothetical protein
MSWTKTDLGQSAMASQAATQSLVAIKVVKRSHRSHLNPLITTSIPARDRER